LLEITAVLSLFAVLCRLYANLFADTLSVCMKFKNAFVLLSLLAIAVLANTQSSPQASIHESQLRAYWIEPSTSLMWAARDSGKDVSWRGAFKYCRNLRLGSYSDWRLANMAELQGIYDPAANAPGLAGMRSEEPTTWHVKGNIFLTAYEWSSNYRMDDRGRPNGYAYYFDFNEGKSNDDPTGWPYPHQFRRALCVRGPQR
jgi:hypothetical protein